ncbi:MAG: hypothetical protein CK424_03685 [Legionella sp.]|nr:MAG: hypothetical protein CK424_03685 [Legionella sp.]
MLQSDVTTLSVNSSKLAFLDRLDSLLSSPPDQLGFIVFNSKASVMSGLLSEYKHHVTLDVLFHEFDVTAMNERWDLLVEVCRIVQVSCDPTDMTLLPKLFVAVVDEIDNKTKKSADLGAMMRRLIALEKQYIESPPQRHIEVPALTPPSASESHLLEETLVSSPMPQAQSYCVLHANTLLTLGIATAALSITFGLQSGYLAYILGLHISLLMGIMAASVGLAMIGYGLYLGVFYTSQDHSTPQEESADIETIPLEQSSYFSCMLGSIGAP